MMASTRSRVYEALYYALRVPSADITDSQGFQHGGSTAGRGGLEMLE
jgi:hypothetical protein